MTRKLTLFLVCAFEITRLLFVLALGLPGQNQTSSAVKIL